MMLVSCQVADAFVVKLFQSRKCFKHARVTSLSISRVHSGFTSLPVSRLFQACACVEYTQAFPFLKSFSHALVENTQAFPSETCFKNALVVDDKQVSRFFVPSRGCHSQLIVQAAPKAQREEVGRLWAQGTEMYIVVVLYLGAEDRSSGVGARELPQGCVAP